ncbi:MAG TPA: MFS transporter [Geminicoccaceae bacterium]|nr:MFS transporter [Geminicoccaceae bacterium]
MVPWFRGEVGRARAAVVAFFVLAGLAFSAWAVRIPDVKAELGLDDATLGLALLGTAAGSVVAMTASGWTIARFGSRRVTNATALLTCITLVLPPLAPSAPLLFVALFVFGAAYGALDVAMNAQAAAVEARWGRPIMSSFHGTFSTGTLLGSFVAGLIAGRGVPPVPHLLATGLALAMVAVVAARSLLTIAAEGDEDGPMFALPVGPLAGVGALAFGVLLAEGAVADWGAVYLRDVLGATAAVGGWGYTAFSLTMAAGRFAGDGLVQRLGPVSVIRGGGALVALGMGVALLVGTVPAALIGFACVGAGLAAAFPVLLSAAGRTPGVPTGTAIAAVATAGYTGFLVGPPAIGLVSAAFGSLRAGLAVVALLGVATALLAGQARWGQRAPHAGTTPVAEATAEL